MKKILFFSLLIIIALSSFLLITACDDSNLKSYQLYVWQNDIVNYGGYNSVSSAEGDFHNYVVGNTISPLPQGCTLYGFTFHGLFTEPYGQGEKYMDENGLVLKAFTEAADEENKIELYAYHTVNKMSITLNYLDGSRELEFDIFSDGMSLPEVPDTDLYEHIGWSTNGGEAVFETLPDWLVMYYYRPIYDTSSFSLEAVYRGVNKTVTLNADGGDVYTESVNIRYDEDFSLPIPTPPQNKFFMGWEYNGTQITDKNGNGTGKFLYTDDITVNAIYIGLVKISFGEDSSTGENWRSYGILETETAYHYSTAPFGYRFDGITVYSSAATKSLSYDEFENGSFVFDSEFDGMEISYVYNDDGTMTFQAKGATTDVSIKINYEYSISVLENISDSLVFGEFSDLRFNFSYSLPVAYKGRYRFEGWKIVGTDTLLTDSEGNSILAWWNKDRIVQIEPVFVEDRNSPYVIYDEKTLLEMKNDPSAKYVLFNDIELSDPESWVPFNFSGELDGCGFKISGISLNTSSGDLGMFLNLSGVVKNLTVDSLSVTSSSGTKVNVGGLCAVLTGSVDSVNIYGSVVADNANAGGICGSVSYADVLNSNNYASVYTNTLEGGATAGGITAYITFSKIYGCKNYGSVSAYANVGGIAGYAAHSNNVTNSTNYGEIVAGGGCVGGCVGKISATSSFDDGSIIFNNLSNEADITANGERVGGIIGFSEFYGGWWENKTFVIDFHKLTNSGAVNATAYVGGCIGYATASTATAAFSPKIEIKLTDLTNTGNITAEHTAGGCIGYGHNGNHTSKIIRSSSSGEISVKHTVGGIAGYMSSFTVDSCDNLGSVIKASGYYIDNNGYYVRIGGVVGYGSNVVNCTNKANIEYSEKGSYIGGIAGVITTTISKCTNEGNITAPKANGVGGVVGRISHSWNYTITKLTNSGNITANESVGGIIGDFNAYFTANDSNHHVTEISELTSSGDVYSYGGFVGGIIGKLEGSAYDHDGRSPKFKAVVTFIQCSGNVSSESVLATGAIIGYASTDSNGSVLDSFTFTGTLNELDAAESAIVGSSENFRVVES